MKVDKQRALGAMLGSAVGDALGAPFEFGPAGAFTQRFPAPARGPATEMVGGGMGWKPGEFTDDTQMAVLLGESLLEHDGLNGADVFERWRQWAATARDVGSQTRAVLSSGDWRSSATRHFERSGHAAGNGSLMRATTSALFAARNSLAESIELARDQSALTHGDPAAGWGAALYHGMIHAAVRGRWPLDVFDDLLALLPNEHALRYRELLMADQPLDNEPSNGSVWTCLAQAVRVLRRASSFEEAMRIACDVGGDVDTVAASLGAWPVRHLGCSRSPHAGCHTYTVMSWAGRTGITISSGSR
jgi:ADP-ribosyl-[dinitrogen reductase] hydrolase